MRNLTANVTTLSLIHLVLLIYAIWTWLERMFVDAFVVDRLLVIHPLVLVFMVICCQGCGRVYHIVASLSCISFQCTIFTHRCLKSYLILVVVMRGFSGTAAGRAFKAVEGGR